MKATVAAIQMVSTPDVSVNLESAAALLKQAAERGANLVLLPEVFAVLEGGPMREFGEIEGSADAVLQNFLADQAKQHGFIVVGGTIPLISRPNRGITESIELIEDGRVRASCLVFNESGESVGRYDKIHLFDVVVNDEQSQYSESRSYEAGTDVVHVETSVGKLGLSVCYDLRFPELYRQLFLAGSQIVTVPAAFTKVTGAAHWEILLRARAIENQCFVVAAGQGGQHSESRETWGHSMIIDPWGVILHQIDVGEGIAIAEIDTARIDEIRAGMPISEQLKL